MAGISLIINGKSQVILADPSTPLLWVLRDELGLVGTKFGCGIASCGACTVHVEGVATRSCILPVASLAGKNITTIEGLSENGDHPNRKSTRLNSSQTCALPIRERV